MNKQFPTKEATAIFASILFLALGLISIWITKGVLDIKGDAVFVSLLLFPILVYMIFSGRLKEIRAPGGLEAKFVDVAEKPVEATFEPIEASVEDMSVVEKGGMHEMKKTFRKIDESKPIVLTLTLNKGGYYDRLAILEYIKGLSQYRNFKFVVILGQDNKFVAYMPAWRFSQILEMDSLGNELIAVINSDRIQELQQYPGIVTKTITTKETNIQALKEMSKQNIEALVVVGEDGRLCGVIEREQVLSRLMLTMAK